MTPLDLADTDRRAELYGVGLPAVPALQALAARLDGAGQRGLAKYCAHLAGCVECLLNVVATLEVRP